MIEQMIRQRGASTQSGESVSLVFTGDLVLDVPGADHWLSAIAPALRSADLAIGHLEVPHTLSRSELAGDVPAPGAPPENLDAIHRAGFAAVTMAGNHMADCGPEGIEDTIAGLDRLGIAHTGAGRNIDVARRPALLEVRGRRIALLSYNCVGPENSWAGDDRAGCNYLRIQTADGQPVTPPAPLTVPDPGALVQLAQDIAAAKEVAELVIVAFHKGIVHTRARLAPYERPLAHAAIAAGAHIVLGHHSHIVRGVEIPEGRPVFHGLGNGCVVTEALSPAQDHPARAEWARRRRTLFGFEPDPLYTLAPFHPEAVNAMLGTVEWHADGRLEAGVIPVFVEPPGRPVLADAVRAKGIIDYVSAVTIEAGLPALQLDAARRPLDLHMTPTDQLQRVLVWIGGTALLIATATDTLAMLGRHARIPLLGSIEIVQCAVLIAASASLIIATLQNSHARVHLLVDRMSPALAQRTERLHSIAGALFVLALLVGSVWITLDLWQGHEESELLRLPYRPLRIAVLLMLAGLLAVFIRNFFTGVRR